MSKPVTAVVCSFHLAMPSACMLAARKERLPKGILHLLCHEQDVYGAQVKLIIERKCR